MSNHIVQAAVKALPVADLRQHCRNPHCRGWLPTSVGNPRDAFCCRLCRSSFYRTRCLVCERPLERRSSNQKTCGRRKCRAALEALTVGNSRSNSFDISTAKIPEGLLSYGGSCAPDSGSNFPDISTAKMPLKPGRGWRLVAGPEPTPAQRHAATIPDGPDGRWEGGSTRRLEVKNRAALAAADQALIAANGDFTDPDWQEVTSPDGVRCFIIRSRQPVNGNGGGGR